MLLALQWAFCLAWINKWLAWLFSSSFLVSLSSIILLPCVISLSGFESKFELRCWLLTKCVQMLSRSEIGRTRMIAFDQIQLFAGLQIIFQIPTNQPSIPTLTNFTTCKSSRPCQLPPTYNYGSGHVSDQCWLTNLRWTEENIDRGTVAPTIWRYLQLKALTTLPNGKPLTKILISPQRLLIFILLLSTRQNLDLNCFPEWAGVILRWLACFLTNLKLVFFKVFIRSPIPRPWSS